MSDRTVLLDGVRVPRFLYGTAWKEGRTQGLGPDEVERIERLAVT
jgi:hypothetical protein